MEEVGLRRGDIGKVKLVQSKLQADRSTSSSTASPSSGTAQPSSAPGAPRIGLQGAPASYCSSATSGTKIGLSAASSFANAGASSFQASSSSRTHNLPPAPAPFGGRRMNGHNNYPPGLASAGGSGGAGSAGSVNGKDPGVPADSGGAGTSSSSNANAASASDTFAGFNPFDFVRKKVGQYLQLSDAPLCRFCSDSWTYTDSSRRPEKKQKYTPRSTEEITKLVAIWQAYAHPRARNFFATTEMLEHVLTQVARGVDSEDDPILADGDQCIFWYGDVTKEEEAAIRMVKPGEDKESITYVNRVLAFIFATDESFQKLMSLPKTPFKMCCQNQLCINLSHISSSAD
eukprot:g8570.t1